MTKKELKKMIKDFRPEFGNLHHIRALEIVKKIKKRDTAKKFLQDTKNDFKELDQEVAFEVQNLSWLMKQ